MYIYIYIHRAQRLKEKQATWKYEVKLSKVSWKHRSQHLLRFAIAENKGYP